MASGRPVAREHLPDRGHVRVKLRIFGGPILHAAQRMQDGRVVPIIEETPGGAPLSAQDVVHRHAGSLRGRSKRRFRRMEERAELLPVAVIPVHPPHGSARRVFRGGAPAWDFAFRPATTSGPVAKAPCLALAVSARRHPPALTIAPPRCRIAAKVTEASRRPMVVIASPHAASRLRPVAPPLARAEERGRQ
jgi:hypothetical protein